MIIRRIGLAVALIGATCLVSTPASANNLLSNPGFETPATGVTPGTPVTYPSLCSGGTSAADTWRVWVNSCNSYMSTDLLPSTLPGGGNYMIEVTTNGYANGIWQQYLPTNTGPTSVFGSAWVYVISGCVGIGVGNDGNTAPSASTCVTDQWIDLTTLNSQSPGNEFIVYTTLASGAQYYVDNTYAAAAPEPSTVVLLCAALGGLALRKRRGNENAA
jgi:hypothetical protein